MTHHDPIDLLHRAVSAGERAAAEVDRLEHEVDVWVARTKGYEEKLRIANAKIRQVEELARWWNSGPSAHRDTMTCEVAALKVYDALRLEEEGFTDED